MTVHVRLFALLSVVCLSGELAQGHHAFSANYDADAVGTLEGVVLEVFWANPHVRYFLEVVNDAGTTELWDIESSNLSGMASAGWTKKTIEVGDQIRVSGDLGRNGRRRLALDKDSLEILR